MSAQFQTLRGLLRPKQLIHPWGFTVMRHYKLDAYLRPVPHSGMLQSMLIRQVRARQAPACSRQEFPFWEDAG